MRIILTIYVLCFTRTLFAQEPVILDPEHFKKIVALRGMPGAWEFTSPAQFARLAMLARRMQKRGKIPHIPLGQLGQIQDLGSDANNRNSVARTNSPTASYFIKTARSTTFENEVFWTLLLSQVGVGPLFYGTTNYISSSTIVTEWVEGKNLKLRSDFTPTQFKSIESSLPLLKYYLESWKIPFCDDLQPFVKADGGILIIDPEYFPFPVGRKIQFSKTLPAFGLHLGYEQFDDYMIKCRRRLAELAQHLRAHAPK